MPLHASALAVPLVAVFACLASALPMIVHLKAKNLAASVLTLGITILNLQNFVNALIWASKDVNSWWNGKILCDIEVKLYIGIGVAANGAIASLFRQISIVLDTERMTAMPSPGQHRVRLAFEVCLCLIVPTLVMAAHCLVQTDRYWLRNSAGCVPSFDNCWPTPFLIFLWPMVLCLVGSFYCIISMIRLWRHRKQMSAVLSNTPGVNASRFFRVFALAFTLILAYCPVAVFIFVENVRVPMHRYSWSYTHPPDFSERIKIVSTPQQPPFDRWAQIATGYLLFGFFGLGQDATQMYKGWLSTARNFVKKSFFTAGKSPKGAANNAHSCQLQSLPLFRDGMNVASTNGQHPIQTDTTDIAQMT